VSGDVAIIKGEGRGYYKLVSAGDIAFLVEYDRMAQRRSTPKEDPAAQKARLEAEVAQRAAEEQALRTHKGERLFEPAEETSLEPQFRFTLEYAPADRAAVGLYPIRVNRLAIDAPVTVLVIDGKEYRFAGKVSITRTPRREKPVRETVYTGGMSESWEGHTSTGGRAKISRSPWNMGGDIYVDGRHFAFGTRGQFGLLYDQDPTLVAKRDAEWWRGHRAAIRAAEAKWRPPPKPFVPVETVSVATTRDPAAQTSPNAEACARKTQFLSGLDEAEGFQQPAHFRSEIAELRSIVKTEMVELQC
jgi:hypothetical protein